MLSVALLEELRTILRDEFNYEVKSIEELKEIATSYLSFGELWIRVIQEDETYESNIISSS